MDLNISQILHPTHNNNQTLILPKHSQFNYNFRYMETGCYKGFFPSLVLTQSTQILQIEGQQYSPLESVHCQRFPTSQILKNW